MALRNLTNPEMLWITGRMIDPEALRPLFEASPLLEGQLAGIEHVHAQVAASSRAPASSEHEKELAALSLEGNDLDVNHHDRLVRGIFRAGESASELIPEKAEEYTALVKRVLSLGLGTGQQSWRGEAGSAAEVEKDLANDKDFRAQLRAFVLPEKHTLLDAVTELVRVGKRLGEIEDRRDVLNAKPAATAASAGDASVPEAPVTVAAARNMWVGTVSTLGDTLRLPKVAVDATTRDKILTLITEAEKKADVRARRSASKAVAPDPTTTPAAEPVVTPAAAPEAVAAQDTIPKHS